MKNQYGKWLLAVAALCCLAPSTFASTGVARKNFNWQIQVPEGGSAAVYVLGAGLTCFGAMFLRSKLAKPPQS